MWRTVLRLQMNNTWVGMRRILKKPLPVTEYIRKAVDCGVYRTREEIRQMREEIKWKENEEDEDYDYEDDDEDDEEEDEDDCDFVDEDDDLESDEDDENAFEEEEEEDEEERSFNEKLKKMTSLKDFEDFDFEDEDEDETGGNESAAPDPLLKRLRQDVIRGSSIHDYPFEYRILKQHPANMIQARTPKRIIKKERAVRERYKRRTQEQADQSLVSRYLRRQKAAATSTSNSYSNNATAATKRRGPEKIDYDNLQQSDRYYRDLLGIPPPTQMTKPTVGITTAQKQRAYASAVLHRRVSRTEEGFEDDGGDRRKEALTMKRVEELLAMQNLTEMGVSKQRAADISTIGEELKNAVESTQPEPVYDLLEDIMQDDRTRRSKDKTNYRRGDPKYVEGEDPVYEDAMIMSTVEGLLRWNSRFRAVPYKLWTVGASTALDHWIARRILNLSEETWQSLLEAEYNNDLSLLSRGRDIVKVRETLFPESVEPPIDGFTFHEGDDRSDEMATGGVGSLIQSNQEKGKIDYLASLNELFSSLPLESDSTSTSGRTDNDSTKKDFDNETTRGGETASATSGLKSSRRDEEMQFDQRVSELLASLSPTSSNIGSSTSNRDGDSFAFSRFSPIQEEKDLDTKVQELTSELQRWRYKHHKVKPFDDWSQSEKQELNQWLRNDYAPVMLESSEATSTFGAVAYGSRFDTDALREALLSQPPVSKEDSDQFWGKLQGGDIEQVAELLEQMRKDGPPPGTSFLLASFWDLPYARQLDRLMNLGAVRPIVDEYAKESERVRFMQRYGDLLLAGVQLDYLVPDPDGPISVDDIDRHFAREMKLKANDRFRLERLPYPASSFEVAIASASANSNEKWTTTMAAHERTRALYMAWNEHKAGRARYEETLFQTGRAGLAYGSLEQDGAVAEDTDMTHFFQRMEQDSDDDDDDDPI